MIRGDYFELLDDAALAKLDEAAVTLLSKGGVRVNHEGLLDMLEGAGCRVSRADLRCYIPEPLMRETVDHIGGRKSMDVEIPTGFNPQHHLTHGGSHPHLLDWPSGRRRLATRQDVVDMARMAHVLDEFARVGKVLTCHEIDQRVEPLWAALTLAGITDKDIHGGETFYVHTIEPLVRMGEVITGVPGETCLVTGCDFFISPLTFDRKQAECFLEKRRFGMANHPGTMPISGLSAPVTVAGTAAVAMAEILAGWVFGYVVAPDLPAGATVASGSLDMKTACASFGSPEAVLQDAAVVQACRRLYGVGVWAAINYVDAKVPGLEATFQKMLPLVAWPTGTGCHVGGDGLLSAGQDYSPVQHLLEAEMGKAVDRLLGGFGVTDETLAVDLTLEMLQAASTNFTETDHTLRHFRAEQWMPRWFDRRPWQGTGAEVASERRLMERLAAHVRGAIERYEPPDVDAAELRELEGIFRHAEKVILGANVTEL